MTKQWILSLIGLTIFINIVLMLFPFLVNDDPTVYFTLSKNIVLSHHWLFLTDVSPWLDKPHLPFWLTAVSFKLFGFHAWSYIFPGFLFYMLGAFYTYKIARLFYADEMVALFSVLIYVSTLRLMLSSLDVRAEAYLLGEIMPACYYWLKYNAKTNLKYLLLGALFTALGLMTKGLFVLITIASGLIMMWIFQKQTKNFIRFKWLAAMVLSFTFALPEFIALYAQFGIAGLKWFFWGSQFGRFLGTGKIAHAHGHLLFFVHTFLWAFLPWSIVFITSLLSNFKKINIFLLGSFFVTFVMFSISKYQLDYYTNIVFPFAAILSANYLYETVQQSPKHWIFRLQMIIAVVLLILSMIVIYFASEKGSHYFILTMILPIMLLASLWIFNQKYTIAETGIIYPVLSINTVFVVLMLMQLIISAPLSAGYTIGKYLTAQKEILPVYAYQDCLNLNVYINNNCTLVNDLDQLPNSSYYLMADTQSVSSILKLVPSAQIVLQKNNLSTNLFDKNLLSSVNKFDHAESSVTLLKIN